MEVLKRLDEAGVKTKSGIMVGLGESDEEVFETIDDLANVKCDVVTIGQYLQPTPKHLPVARFVHPDDFKTYKDYALNKGFKFVESGPLVRSSYHAEKHIF
jgi:lipoic acid synthetase